MTSFFSNLSQDTPQRIKPLAPVRGAANPLQGRQVNPFSPLAANNVSPATLKTPQQTAQTASTAQTAPNKGYGTVGMSMLPKASNNQPLIKSALAAKQKTVADVQSEVDRAGGWPAYYANKNKNKLTEQTQAITGEKTGAVTSPTTQSQQVAGAANAFNYGNTQNTPNFGTRTENQPSAPIKPGFSGFVSGLAQQAGNPGQTVSDYQNSLTKNTELGKQAQNIQDILAEQNRQLEQEGQGEARGLTTLGGAPGLGLAGQFREGLLAKEQANTAAAQARLTGIDKQLTAQGQLQSGYGQIGGLQQGALTSGGNLAYPMQVSPGTSVINPQTSQETYSGLGGLTGLGIAQQNISQAQQFQGEAADLSKTLNQIDLLAPTVGDFLTKSGLNSQGSPFYNKSIKSYMAQVQNPGDVVSLNGMMADLKTYTAQILGSSGLNPTEVSDTLKSFDPSDLTPQQLAPFIQNLKNLGQIRLQPLQESAAGSYGANTVKGNPYTGAPAQPSTQSAYATPNQSALTGLVGDNQNLQGLIGGAINWGAGLTGLITGLYSKIFH